MAINKMLIAVAALSLAACNVKDPLYRPTENDGYGRVTLTADWSARGEGVTIPGAFHVRADGDDATKRTFMGETVEHPDLFTQGTHRLHLWHDTECITVSGNTASVGVPSIAAEGIIESNPGWFFTCAADVEIQKDKVSQVTAAMCQQVRELTLVIAPTGGTTDKIERIAARLSGAARTLDINNGTHGSPSGVALMFAKQADGTWNATVRLLGIAGTEQKLTGTISFTGGAPADLHFGIDISERLARFNDNKTIPLTVTIDVATPSPSEVPGSDIGDWGDGGSGEGDAQ